ncbi:MAG: RNA polymerase sigma factor [Bacteroidota bacterium]
MAAQDQELIVRAQHGDAAAFEQLVFRYDKQVLNIAATYVNSAEDAKDVYQEVLMRVYRGLKKFQFRSEFSTWLYRITTNVCLTHRSRRKRHSHTSLDQEMESDDAQPHSLSETLPHDAETDQHTVSADITLHVQEALEQLSPKQKMVFTLRHFQGYKLKEIAEVMDCTEGTVKKYLFTATQRMREQLKEVFE